MSIEIIIIKLFQGFKDRKQTKVMIMFSLRNNKKFVFQIKKKKKRKTLEVYTAISFIQYQEINLKDHIYMVRK